MVSISMSIEDIIRLMSICIMYENMLMSWPVVMMDWMQNLAPIHDMSSMHAYMQKLIRGMLSATMRSALTDVSRTSEATLSNFSVSSFSRTKVFTTLMPRTFSCTTALSLSNRSNIFSNSGNAFLMMRNSPTASIGSVPTNTSGSLPLMRKAAIRANTSVTGAWNSILVSIMKHIWTWVMSRVILVTRPAVVNLSTLLKEKRWML